MKKFQRILLVSHYTQTPGMADKYFNYCKRFGFEVCLIKNPLFPQDNLPSKLQYKTKTITFSVPVKGQFILEGYQNSAVFRKQLPDFSRATAVCFDPLSFLNVYLYKRIYKVNKIVYYNLDYSRHRFGNRFINSIYTKINRFAYFNSDHFIYLTDAFITDIDPKKIHAAKNILIKHPVETKLINLQQKKIKNSIVYAGSLLYSVNFERLFAALTRLYNEKIPFSFTIYGRLQDTAELKKIIRKCTLNSVVQIHDVVENAELVRNLLPRYAIGVCPYVLPAYSQRMDHMYHGKDLTSKLVEYIAAGLPVITTPIFSAFSIITDHKFGMLVKTEEEWYVALKTLLTNNALRESYAKNARKFAKTYDEEAVITPLLEKII